jgi:hypothetical protein
MDGGLCIRDCSERSILAGSNFLRGRLNTIERGTMTIKEATLEVIQRVFSHVSFKSDSKIVVIAIFSRISPSEFSALISSIKSSLLLFANFEVNLLDDKRIWAAHTLTRVVYFWSSHCLFDSISFCIDNLLINEMN